MVKIIEDRDARILNAAFDLAATDSYQWITRDQVAANAGVSAGTVNTVFGEMRLLKQAVIRLAIERRNLHIIAEAIGAKHPIIAAECPEDLRAEALASLMSA